MSWNVSATAATLLSLIKGAAKLGDAVLAFVSVTAVPPVCTQANVRLAFSGSLPLPAKLTAAPSLTCLSTPALAMGSALPTATSFTVTCTRATAVAPFASVTASWKVSTSVTLKPSVGATNVGVAELPPLSVTAVPAVWLQA